MAHLPRKRGIPLRQDDVERIGRIIDEFIEKDQLSNIQSTVKKYAIEQRQMIVSYKVNDNAPLFKACLKGNVPLVTFLIDKCGAELEQRGVYEVSSDNTRHDVTPLWAAAVANRLEVVKILLQRGANVNAVSDTGSTPVRSACYMTNLEVVQYLVKNGGNIHKANINGGTCLINSVQSPELCEFLIKEGARVNDKDNSGNLALHYAIREGRTKTVQLLLEKGCDYTSTNLSGDDALQCAGLRGQVEIAQEIISLAETRDNKPFSLQKLIDTWELLGANIIDEKQDVGQGFDLWKTAMEWRHSQSPPLLKKLPSETHQAFQHAREPNSMEELMSYATHHDAIFMHSLLMKIRILGPSHKDSTFAMMYRGAVYADLHQYQLCVELWKYALHMRYSSGETYKHECIFTVQALVKLFWEMQLEFDSNAHSEAVIPSNIIEVFEMMTALVKEFMERKNEEARRFMDPLCDDVLTLMQLCLHMIHMGTRLEATGHASKAEQHRFRCQVYELLQRTPQTSQGETLLHLAVDAQQDMVGEEYFSPLPSLDVINMLLDCGADVNAVDSANRTVLHRSLSLLEAAENSIHSIPVCLLQRGAHGDVVDSSGRSPLACLQKAGYDFCPVRFLTLKCLCAQVIKRDQIPFERELPKCLANFVQQH